MLWLGVGIGLIVVACYWLSMTIWPWNLLLAVFSLAMGLVVYSCGFSRIARKNVGRIAAQPDTVCLFAFQSWRSYCLVLFMMLLGFTIRHLPIPKFIDAVIYFTIGSALAFSSSLYFEEFSRE
jgi:FtsH-binding integral membrane protein